MARTTYRWTPYRVHHRLFPLAVAGAWFALWLSPPGVAALDLLRAAVPSAVLGPLGLGVLTAVITYGSIAVFHRTDTTGRPAWLAARKVQQPFSDPRRPSTAEAIRVLALNHGLLVVGLVLLGFGLHWRGWSATDPVPAWYVVLGQLVALGLLTEILFFSAHWVLHTRWLYRNVHVVHHRFRAPTAWSAQYAHPLEYIVGNMVPLAVPMLVVAPDILTLWGFGAIALLNTQLVHSGYQLPFAPWTIHHDLHHFKVTVNYGSIGLMDTLCRTRLDRPDPRDERPAASPREPVAGAAATAHASAVVDAPVP